MRLRMNKIRLTGAGRHGLEAVCRSAFEMVALACNKVENGSLWLRMPKEMHTIDEARYAYDLLKEMRESYPCCNIQTLEASVALRNVLVLMIIDVYASFDTRFKEIMHAEGQQQKSIEFPSQLRMARASITRMAKHNNNA